MNHQLPCLYSWLLLPGITSAFILSDVLTNGDYDGFTTSLLPMERSNQNLWRFTQPEKVKLEGYTECLNYWEALGKGGSCEAGFGHYNMAEGSHCRIRCGSYGGGCGGGGQCRGGQCEGGKCSSSCDLWQQVTLGQNIGHLVHKIICRSTFNLGHKLLLFVSCRASPCHQSCKSYVILKSSFCCNQVQRILGMVTGTI